MLKNKISHMSGTNFLITGGSGMLGRAFQETIKGFVPNSNVLSPSKEELNVSNLEQVLSYENQSPEYILHCAAESRVDYCEEHPEKSFNVLVKGTSNIIQLAKKTNAKLFYPQSFLIYDGKEIPINEKTVPNPLSMYGRHKFDAEKLIQKEINDSLIVRMGGFFGGREIDKRFVGQITLQLSKLIKEGIDSIEVGNRVWQPTFTNDLAYNSLMLLGDGKNGVYNMASHGQASFYEITKEIVSILDIDKKINVLPVDSSQVSQKENAKRPSLALMENRRLQDENRDFQRDWKSSLKEYLNHDYFKMMF